LEHRGRAYADKGDFDQAIIDYTEALKGIGIGEKEILKLRSNAYYLKGSYNQAIKDLKAVLKINPYDVEARKSLKEIRQKNGWKIGKLIWNIKIGGSK